MRTKELHFVYKHALPCSLSSACKHTHTHGLEDGAAQAAAQTAEYVAGTAAMAAERHAHGAAELQVRCYFCNGPA